MRLIHTSDWHLGRTLHGENLLPAQEDFLRWLLGEAVRQQAGAVGEATATTDISSSIMPIAVA